MFLLVLCVCEVRTDLFSMVKEGAGHCHLVCQWMMRLEVQVLVRVCALQGSIKVVHDPCVQERQCTF